MTSTSTTISYDSATNKRLQSDPSLAQSLAENAVQQLLSSNNPLVQALILMQQQQQRYHTIIGLGPGRSGTKSLSELLSFQPNVVHCEHEMIVPRVFPRSRSGRIDVDVVDFDEALSSESTSSTSTSASSSTAASLHQPQHDHKPRNKQVKGSWGADRRLEWDAPNLARGEPPRSAKEEALWRVLRILEQHHEFESWVNDYYTRGGSNEGRKPKRLGSRGWREHNDKHASSNSQEQEHDNTNPAIKEANEHETTPLAVAAVSSVGLAYAHEYIALDPTIKIIILLRPCEEVVKSFMTKSRGRNHWQKHVHHSWKKKNEALKEDDYCNGDYNNNGNEAVAVQRDKTWDSAFPNMSNEECQLAMMSTATMDNNNPKKSTTIIHQHCHHQHNPRPDKVHAIRAYCKLYSKVAKQLSQQYPDNVRIYDMQDALNNVDVQSEMLKWCCNTELCSNSSNEPVIDTCLHLNKKK